MLARALAGGFILWIYSSVMFQFGSWYANRHKPEDLRSVYLRGYNDGYEARSIDGGEMAEGLYQTRLINRIRALIPNSIVLKNDSSYMPGIPDILVLYEDHWAMLEVKVLRDSPARPNQQYYVDLLDGMSFAAFIYPEIEEAVLYDLQFAFGLIREARLPES